MDKTERKQVVEALLSAASALSGNALKRIEGSGWSKMSEEQKLKLLSIVFQAVDLGGEWGEIEENATADDVLVLFRAELSNDSYVDKYIPWLANKIKKNITAEELRAVWDFKAICRWAHETRTDIGSFSIEDAAAQAKSYVPKAAKKALEESSTNPVVYRFPDGYKIVQLNTDEALKHEGDRMRHCVGDYCEKVKSGMSVVYSLRSPDGDPEKDITMEYVPDIKAFKQMFGVVNRGPTPEQKDYLLEFIEKKFPHDIKGLLLAGKPAKDVDLRGADLTDAYLEGAILTDADLTGAFLTNADLTLANLRNANLTDAKLIDAKLYGAKLIDANLTNADLTLATLTKANLEDANLTNANLGGADLEYADLTNAILTDANLTVANLTNAILYGADLTNAILTNATLTRVDLRGANLEGVKYDEYTKWPEGFTPPQMVAAGHTEIPAPEGAPKPQVFKKPKKTGPDEFTIEGDKGNKITLLAEVNGGSGEEKYKKFPLSVLVEHAKAFDDFDKFSKFYVIEIGHGYYWHLTQDPNFTVREDTGPVDYSSMAMSTKPGELGALMITSDFHNWESFYNDGQITRPYAALFDASAVEPRKLKQVPRVFGNEIYLQPEDAKKLRKVGLYKIQYAKKLEKKLQKMIPESKEGLLELWKYAHKKHDVEATLSRVRQLLK